MRIKAGINLIIVVSIVLPLGCAPGIKREVIVPKLETRQSDIPLVPKDVIDKKIAVLENLLAGGRLKTSDAEIALALMSDYKKLRSASVKSGDADEYRKAVDMLFRNLTILDEKYLLEKAGQSGLNYSNLFTEWSSKKKDIRQKYLSGDYQGVIAYCAELEVRLGPDSLTPEIGILYALSLAKKNMKREAISIADRMIRELEGKPGLADLRANLIQWQIDVGNKQKAGQIYEKLMDDLEQTNMLIAKLPQDIAGKGYQPATSKIPSNELGSQEADSDYSRQTQTLLGEVDGLLKQNAFSEAKLLVLQWRLKNDTMIKEEFIDNLMKNIENAEEKYNENPNQEEERKEIVKQLIEADKPEDALAELMTMERNVVPETEELKATAIDKLIVQEREKAAEIFLLARKTNDPGKKRELLVSSHNILKGLIEKYPSSSMIDKLNSNLEKVKEELDKLSAK